MMSVLEIFDPIKYNVGPFTSAPKKDSSLSTHVLEKIDELYDQLNGIEMEIYTEEKGFDAKGK